MSNIIASTLFSNLPAEYSELVGQLDPVDALNGGFNGVNRKIGLKGCIFRDIINGKEENVWDSRNLDVVVLTASKVGRAFYAEKWAEDSTAVAPTCWSVDGDLPAEGVPDDQRQASKCNECPQNIKGSAEGDRRACKFNQRVAVLLEEEIAEKKVYQLQVPAKSIFGDPENGNYPLQAYARFLAGHKTPVSAIVTKMSFDTNSATPKLFFKAVRPLTGPELAVVVEMQKHEDALKAIDMTVKIDAKPKADTAKKITHTETPHTEAKSEQLFDDAEVVPETTTPVKTSGRKPVDKTAAKPETSTPQPAKSSRKPSAAATAAKEEDLSQPEVRTTKSKQPAPALKPEVENVLANWDMDDVEEAD
jgi:hypothetical protein